MYLIDPNLFFNAILVLTVAAGVGVFLLTAAVAIYGGPRTRPLLSYLYLLCGLFGAFVAVVLVLGLRGQKSDARPWHIFLDMKYQPKYSTQGPGRFFADGRASRLPPEGTIPYDGADYVADAGYHAGPNPDFLRADRRYYTGIADPEAKTTTPEGAVIPRPPLWQDGRLVGEGYYVNHIPELAIERAGGWEALIRRGRQQFNTHCAVCHGTSGRGGGGEIAYGIVGAYGLSVAPSSVVAVNIQTQPDGQLFHTITHGVRNMPGYGHQVKVQDRWAIVAYLRVLQYAAGTGN